MRPIISMHREVIDIAPTAGGIQRIRLGRVRSYLWGIRIPTVLASWLLRQFFGLEVQKGIN